MNRSNYEPAPEYPASAYKVYGYPGIAWTVRGWETEPDEDTHWTGIENRTGKLICVMVGDDRQFRIDPEDVTPLKGSEYCRECGQIGCGCSVIPDEEEDEPEPIPQH